MERGGWVASSLGEQGDFLPTSTVTPAIINQEETHVLTSNIQICTIDTQHSLVPRSTLPSLMWPGSEAEVCSLVPRSTLPPLVWPGSEAEVCSLVPRPTLPPLVWPGSEAEVCSLVPRPTLPPLVWPGSEAEVCSLVPRPTLPPLVWPGSEAEVCSLVPRSLALTLQKAVFEMRLQIKGSLFTNNVGCVPVSEWMC